MTNQTKIVFLDSYTSNQGDLSWDALREQGDFVHFDRTKGDELIERAHDADIIITNKVPIDKTSLSQLPKLKLICVAATGYNVVDIAACNERKIPVCNVRNYSTQSVAQHVFASLLSVIHSSQSYFDDVARNAWASSEDFAYTRKPIKALSDMTFGIFGFGNIGRAVAKVAHSFNMNVIALNKYPERNAVAYVEYVGLEALLRKSDVLSLHAPLNPSTKKIINISTLAKMKPEAILINTARGGLVDEVDLAHALKNNQIKAAILDVLNQEPPPHDHPLTKLKNCFITPHQAWINQSARRKLIVGLAENINAFLNDQSLDSQVNSY